MNIPYRAAAEINLDALSFNLKTLQSLCPSSRVIAIVKANAYGHSDELCSKRLYRDGVRHFAVSNPVEGERIRGCLPADAEILVFGYVYPPQLEEAVKNRLTLTAGSVEYAALLNDFAASKSQKIPVHIALDTGMTRVGVRQAEEIDRILALPHLDVKAIYSHFAVGDMPSGEQISFTKTQHERLYELAHERHLPLHCQNSGGIIFHSNMKCDFIRPGISLYGLSPNTAEQLSVPLKQVMTLKSFVNQLKEVNAGVDIGYGRTYTTDKRQLIALIPVGYADGYSRALSNRGTVAVNGVLCPIRGRVCMDQMMVDVSNAPTVAVGDEVLLYSNKFRETSLDYIAELAGTITNELVCNVSARVPRVAR